MKVLIVEDSPVFRQMLENLFAGLGYDTLLAESCARARAHLESQTVQLICLDMHLPDGNGLTLAEEIRGQLENRLTPTLMLTADEDSKVWQRAVADGVTEVFGKTNLSALYLTLSKFIERHQQRLSGRVLLAEDSPTASQLAIHLLGKLGLSVEAHTMAEAAFIAFTEYSYDLVVTDIVLEGSMSGVGLVRAIRTMESPDKAEAAMPRCRRVETGGYRGHL